MEWTWKNVFVWGRRGVGLFVLAILSTNLVILATSKAYMYKEPVAAPHAEAVLIPGAAILRNGKLSPIFIDRVDTAIAVYEAQRVSKILVSGDNSTLSYNEVNPVRLYLMSKGVPDEDIFLDHAGFDTYSSLYRARDIFGVSTLIIATQSFHLPRAIFIGQALGLEVYGMNADEGSILFSNYIREVFANEKAVLDLLRMRTPKYLGETIPITGDGRNYP